MGCSATVNFLVTTHSSYILSSANLLIQSASVENHIGVNINEETIIQKAAQNITTKDSAYKIGEDDKDTLKDIVDQTSGLIESIEIDTISQKTNEESDKLDILEMKYDLQGITGMPC